MRSLRLLLLLVMCLLAQEVPTHAQPFYPTPNNAGQVAGFVPMCIAPAGSSVAGKAVACGTNGTGYTTPTAASTCNTSLSMSAGFAYDVTLTGACVLSLTAPSGGSYQVVNLILRQSGSGGFVPVLPTNVYWPGGPAPIPNSTAGVIDLFTFSTTDGGVTWLAGN